VKKRGFLAKLSKKQLLAKARIFNYDDLCAKIEDLM